MTDGPIAPGCLESVVWPCSVLDWSSHHTDLPSSRASGKPCPPWVWTQRVTWKGQCYAGLVLRLILSPVFSGGQGTSYYLANAHSGRRQAAATTPQQLFPTSHCPAPPLQPRVTSRYQKLMNLTISKQHRKCLWCLWFQISKIRIVSPICPDIRMPVFTLGSNRSQPRSFLVGCRITSVCEVRIEVRGSKVKCLRPCRARA